MLLFMLLEIYINVEQFSNKLWNIMTTYRYLGVLCTFTLTMLYNGLPWEVNVVELQC